MTSRVSGPKGAPDIVPPESLRQERIIARALAVFKLYGYKPAETPVFEHTELFERGLESGSDIVTKEMYTFEDKGGRSLTLRPDMTAPVMRAVLGNSLDRAGLPVKLYYAAQVFRHERPQAGRYRQFRQVGVEAVGSAGPAVDAEVVSLASEVFSKVGLTGVSLKLNSIGHPECHALYMPKLVEFLQVHSSELCADCQRKVTTNPLRTFDCKAPADREIMRRAPVISDHLCVECKAHYELLKDLLDVAGVEFTEEPRLVRGLDYYSRTAFEFVAEGLGSQDAVGAGGRYDGLSEQLGGPALGGVGFGLGVDRMSLALNAREEAGRSDEGDKGIDVFVVAIGEAAQRAAFELATDLRREGVSADLDYAARSIKGQFKAADRAGAKKAVVIGEEELAAGAYTVKDMETGEEISVDAPQVVARLKPVAEEGA